MKNILLSDQNKPLRKLDGLLMDVQDSDGITSLTLYPVQKVRTPEGGMLHRWYPPILPSHASPEEKNHQERERHNPTRSEDCK